MRFKRRLGENWFGFIFLRHAVHEANRRLLESARTARRLGLASTGHASRGGAALGSPGPTNLALLPGATTAEALIADIADGLYVTEMMGMGVQLVTGDYSRGAAGFRIRHGELAEAVDEVTVAGNLADMLLRLVPAADLELSGAVDAPTVRIDGLTVAGR